jgi:hypothetical protein
MTFRAFSSVSNVNFAASLPTTPSVLGSNLILVLFPQTFDVTADLFLPPRKFRPLHDQSIERDIASSTQHAQSIVIRAHVPRRVARWFATPHALSLAYFCDRQVFTRHDATRPYTTALLPPIERPDAAWGPENRTWDTF